MTDLDAVSPTIIIWQPPTIEIQPHGSSVLARVLCAVTLCEDTPEWETPTFELVTGFSHPFETPRYSRAYVHAMHLIEIALDIKIALIEKRHAESLEQFEAEQERLTNRLTPLRSSFVKQALALDKQRHCLEYFGWHLPTPPHKITIIPFRRFEEDFTDHTIAALYKAELRTIKRLTRGKR